MKRVAKNVGASNIVIKRIVEKRMERVKSGSQFVIVNGLTNESKRLYGYETKASYLRRLQKANDNLAQIKANELNSLEKIFRKIASGVQSTTKSSSVESKPTVSKSSFAQSKIAGV